MFSLSKLTAETVSQHPNNLLARLRNLGIRERAIVPLKHQPERYANASIGHPAPFITVKDRDIKEICARLLADGLQNVPGGLRRIQHNGEVAPYLRVS
jgi:hypothetical protein